MGVVVRRRSNQTARLLTVGYSQNRPSPDRRGNRSNVPPRLGAAVQISALNVCGERNLTLAAFPVVCPLSSEPDLHWRSVRRAMTSRRRCRSSYRSRWRRTGPIDPLQSAAAFSANDWSTLESDLRRRRRKSHRRGQRSFAGGHHRRGQAPRLNDSIRRPRTHAADPSATFAALNSSPQSGRSRRNQGPRSTLHARHRAAHRCRRCEPGKLSQPRHP